MKKKLLVFLLLMVTVIVLAVPTPALAWGGRSTQTAFTANAQLFGINPGTVTPRYLGTSYILLNTVGEQIYGTIGSSNGWPAIQGLNILFQHQSNTFVNLNTMKITGTATGTITVLDSANNPVMQGSYSAFIRGDVGLDPVYGLIYTKIYDTATFTLNGAPGTAFAGISANGLGFANLSWQFVPQIGQYSLAGPMTLAGTYR
jgi:hypothetical protein